MQFLNAVRIVVCTSSSVLWSIAAVASSNTIIRLFRISARAKHRSCLWPTLFIKYSSILSYFQRFNYLNAIYIYLRLSPPSLHSNMRPFSSERANSLRWTCSRADHNSWSEWLSNGSKFIRSEPEKTIGSWGMMLILCLKSCNPISLIFTSSISISPSDDSSSRNRAIERLDFPAPVLPTIPICIFIPNQTLLI